MKNRWIALLLALFVLACSGCGLITQAGEDPELPEEERLSRPYVTVEPPSSNDAPPEEPAREPVEPEEPVLVWCTDPVLAEEQMPGNYGGLELPVEGATGYTSTPLPLWASLEDWEAARQAVEEWERKRAEEEAAAAAQQEPVLPEEGASPAPETAEDASSDAPIVIAATAASASPGEETDPVEGGPSGGESEPPAEDSSPVEALPPVEEEPLPDGGDAPEEEPPSEDGGTPPIEQEPAGSSGGQEPAEDPAPPEGSGPAGTEELPESPETVAPPAAPEEPEEPQPSETDGALAILPAGAAMTVLREEGEWWQVRCKAEYTGDGGSLQTGEVTGWVAHRYCMINLPDVIPSMVYNATNAYASRFRSCGKEIEDITGKQLYSGPDWNERLDQMQFMMPVLYSMAPRLCAAQRAALAEGNTLVLYEGYRPQETQLKVAGALQKLMGRDPEIKTALTTKPWSIPWFIATSTSNHQWGYAVDVNLARVSAVETRRSGAYGYTQVTEYEEYEMPTPIHELSPAAATFTQAIGPNSNSAWKSAKQTEAFAACEGAVGLQGYCTGAGLSPLASEWWHFNDLASRANVLDNLGRGDFEIIACRSVVPPS